MQRIITITVVAVATVAAAASVWFWALRPLGFASYLSSTGASDADIIRQYWPHRLVEPEWVSATLDRLMNWHFAEVCARLAVVAVSWSLTVGGFFYGVIRRRRVRPNRRCSAWLKILWKMWRSYRPYDETLHAMNQHRQLRELLSLGR